MKFCTPVDKDKSVKFAMALLLRANLCIHMTMDLQGEVNNPLPKKYHEELSHLSKKNINIYRYAYGNKILFKKMRASFAGVKMIYGGPMNHYQRMLIIDKKVGMFALGGNIFYTTFKPLIQSLLIYAKIK